MTLVLILARRPGDAARERTGASTSSAPCSASLGLAGFVFALIEQPRYGWGSPAIFVPLVGGLVAFAAFLAYERRARGADAEARAVRAAATSPSATSRR